MTDEQNKLIKSYEEKFENDLNFAEKMHHKINGSTIHYSYTIDSVYLYKESRLWNRLHESDTLEEFELELNKLLLRSYKAKMFLCLFLITNRTTYSYEYVMSKPDEMFLECKYDFEKFKEMNKILEYKEEI